MQKLKRVCVLLLSVIMVLCCTFTSFADLRDLMIYTDSNAINTFAMTRSSVGFVTNSIDYKGASLWTRYEKPNGSRYYMNDMLDDDGEGRVDVPASMSGQPLTVSGVGIKLTKDSLPSSGQYRMRIDYASDIFYECEYAYVMLYNDKKNVTSVRDDFKFYAGNLFEFNAGDFYFDAIIDLAGVDQIIVFVKTDFAGGSPVAGTFSVAFDSGYDEDEADLFVDYNSDSAGEYMDNVSSSLSDLSSSVDSMTEDLSSAAENLEYISTSQNLIIQGIDNVIMHISDQLYAFWDQLFNLIHLPTLAKMDDIITAIQNMDLEIEVNLDGLKTSIDNMSTAVQNKLQSTTNQITGGYDNSGMTSDKSELDGVLNQYEQAEEDLFDDAKGNINDFEFDTPLEQFTGPLSDVSYFLSGLFEAMGPMNVIITFSLTLTIAMVMIGWYRFKGGR